MNNSAILAVLTSDALTAEGPPLIKFLTAFGAAAGDPLKISAALVGLQGDVIASLPSLETTLAQQITAALTAKLQGAITAAQAAVTPKSG
jgi:hypothetical protein